MELSQLVRLADRKVLKHYFSGRNPDNCAVMTIYLGPHILLCTSFVHESATLAQNSNMFGTAI